MADLWVRMAFAISTPSSLMALGRALVLVGTAAAELLVLSPGPANLTAAKPALDALLGLEPSAVGPFLFAALTFPLAAHLTSFMGGWRTIAEELSAELTRFLGDFPLKLRNSLPGKAPTTTAVAGDSDDGAPHQGGSISGIPATSDDGATAATTARETKKNI